MGSRGIEYVNISGLRVDGRKPNEIRSLSCKLGVVSSSDGSALIEQGNTRVIASVHGPREASRRKDAEHDQAVLACEIHVAPFAGNERRKRRQGDKRDAEASSSLRASLESVVQSRLYPRSQIDIYVLVLQSDGGHLSAAVNASCLALIDAGVAMKDFVVAVGVTHIQKSILLDPNFIECSAGGPELVVALLPRSGKITLASMDSRLSIDRLGPCLDLASVGCNQVYEILRSAAREATARKVRGGELLTMIETKDKMIMLDGEEGEEMKVIEKGSLVVDEDIDAHR